MKKEKEINVNALNRHRERLTVNYFFNKTKYVIWTIAFVVLSVGFAVLGFYFASKKMDATPGRRLHYVFVILCALSLLMAVLVAIRLFSNYINHVTLEKLIQRDHDTAFDGLLSHLAINNNRHDFIEDPLEVHVPHLYPGRNRLLYRYDKKSKKLYYSQTLYTWLLMSERNIFLYQVSVNHIHGLVGYEEAHEIAYTDVVDVKTAVTKERNIETLTLSLTLVNGQELKVILRRRPTRAAKYMSTLKRKERKDILESGSTFDGSTDALSDNEASIIAKVRHAIRDRK